MDNGTLQPGAAMVTMQSKQADKIRLFRAMFAGREDVFAKRWESKSGKCGYSPVCTNEWVRGVCEKAVKSGVRTGCDKCPHRAFEPISDAVIEQHLRGTDEKGNPFVMGAYPLLSDDTVRFAAIDFDKSSWRADTASVIDTLRDLSLPVARERSRSGNGAHLWFFFDEPISASLVRDVLTFVLTLTMERNPSMGLDSYDRIFPNQSRLPKGGFGNLIALPLQGIPRRVGNSVFVDDNLVPYPDQWRFLSEIPLISKARLAELAARARYEHRLVVAQREEEIARSEPWSLFSPPTKVAFAEAPEPIDGDIRITLGNAIYIAQDNLPPVLRGRLIRLAAFANPAFRDAEWLRLPVFNIPRVICRAIDGENHLVLPRGCLDDILATLKSAHASWTITDKRFDGHPISARFTGELRPEQKEAAKALLAHDTGVLAAGTAFGKTVVAAYMIAARGTNTLILVNRKPLADQWAARLAQFLDVSPDDIGRWGGGKRRYTGKIDIALIQSLTRKGQVNCEIVSSYGHLIVDECHGISAPSFERVANAFAGKYVLGLSATIVRKDGHHPIIHMQCGPVRHRVDAKAMDDFSRFTHTVEVRLTGFEATPIPGDTAFPDSESATDSPEKTASYATLVAQLAADRRRNDLIVRDVLDAVQRGRSPVVITERRDHLEALRSLLADKIPNVLVFHGQMGAKQRKALDEARAAIPDDSPRVLLATGSYLGEGFDDARLDTLFLTLPISWKGRLTQYAGRLHRRHVGKRDVAIYDYADTNVALFARMFNRRCDGYKAIGYSISMPVSTASGLPANVSLIRERKLDETYAESVRRLLRDGVSAEEIDLFAYAAEQIHATSTDAESGSRQNDELARSAVERFLFKHLDAIPQTQGLFELNGRLPIPFGANPYMEVDLLARKPRLAVEIDGWRHFNDRNAYRRDRRKDELLQTEGYFVLRFLAEDVMEHLNDVFTRITRHLTRIPPSARPSAT